MYNNNNVRYRPNQKATRARFNQATNHTKRVNKTLNQRGGTKL